MREEKGRRSRSLRLEKKWKVLKLIACMIRASEVMRGVKGKRRDKEASFEITFSILRSDGNNFLSPKVGDDIGVFYWISLISLRATSESELNFLQMESRAVEIAADPSRAAVEIMAIKASPFQSETTFGLMVIETSQSVIKGSLPLTNVDHRMKRQDTVNPEAMRLTKVKSLRQLPVGHSTDRLLPFYRLIDVCMRRKSRN